MRFMTSCKAAFALGDLSPREYFAIQIMQGLCAAIQDYSPNRIIDHAGIAAEAVELADELTRALEKDIVF
jgi:hypothetical protein